MFKSSGLEPEKCGRFCRGAMKAGAQYRVFRLATSSTIVGELRPSRRTRTHRHEPSDGVLGRQCGQYVPRSPSRRGHRVVPQPSLMDLKPSSRSSRRRRIDGSTIPGECMTETVEQECRLASPVSEFRCLSRQLLFEALRTYVCANATPRTGAPIQRRSSAVSEVRQPPSAW